MTTTEEKLRKIVAEQLTIHESEIRPKSRLEDELAADSLDRIELSLAIADDDAHGGFEIEVPDEQMEAFVTFGDMLKYIEVRLEERSAGQ